MTDDMRHKFYLPTWRRAFARHWRRAGELGCVPRDDRPANPYVAPVEAAALALAQAAGRRMPTEEMLRHAATWVATTSYHAYNPHTKVTTSSKALSRSVTNHLVRLLDLLLDPANLAASVRWDHPEVAESEEVDWDIRRFPPAYVAALAKSDRFKTGNWKGLPLAERKALLLTLRNRVMSSRRRSEAPMNQEGRKT